MGGLKTAVIYYFFLFIQTETTESFWTWNVPLAVNISKLNRRFQKHKPFLILSQQSMGSHLCKPSRAFCVVNQHIPVFTICTQFIPALHLAYVKPSKQLDVQHNITIYSRGDFKMFLNMLSYWHWDPRDILKIKNVLQGGKNEWNIRFIN